MHNAGMSCNAIDRNLGYRHTSVSRLVVKHAQTGDVQDRPRSRSPPVTTHREDRDPLRLIRRETF